MMTYQQGANCPHCGQVMTWSQVNQQWYCNRCELFIQGSGPPSSFENLASEIQGLTGREKSPQRGQACFRCHGYCHFIREYNRWYCYNCKQWL